MCAFSTLAELFVQNHTVSYRMMDRTRDIKRLQVNPLPGRYNESTNGCRRASEALRTSLVAGVVRGVR